ncbi:uncharacterized protein PAC_09118 [Phialocephala subalpina]|uniref:Heterokaryon incompatibility domain-containing protein n=1 Tax=Phialocephala subalpina TaxID=576137 RepID=A0A1L7X2I1_9HELO|nr:uncharacterized protein PAC_09118 [Phialocephala subalpina]
MERNVEDRMARQLSNTDRSDTDAASTFPVFTAFFHPSDMVKYFKNYITSQMSPESLERFESPRMHGEVRRAPSRTCDDTRGSKLYQVPEGLETICDEDSDGELQLKEIGYGTSDALHIVRCMMDLALGTSQDGHKCEIDSPENEKGKHKAASAGIYESLGLKESQMRLIDLMPGEPTDPIRVTVFNVDSLVFNAYKIMDGTKGLSYQALSYVWATDKGDITISANDTPFRISANLGHALACLRRSDASRTLWVDAICINQKDEEEKTGQVSMMDRIYRNADDVLIYLGLESDDSNIVMDYLEADDLDFPELTEERANTQSPGPCAERTSSLPARVAVAWTKTGSCGPRMRSFVGLGGRGCGLSKRSSWPNATLYDKTTPTCIRLQEIMGMDTRGKRTQIDELMNWSRSTEALLFTVDPRPSSAENHNLSSFLALCAPRNSTDARDRIFALSGMLDPLCRAVLAPNYSVPTQHVFLLATIYVLTQKCSSDPFNSYGFNRIVGYPSWSLDFTKPSPHESKYWFAGYGKAHWYSKRLQPAVHNQVLALSGIEIDVVQRACNLDENASNFEVLTALWQREKLIDENTPSRVLPDSAAPAVPDFCLFPPCKGDEDDTVDQLRRGLKDKEAEERFRDGLQSFIRPDCEIPGSAHFHCEVMKIISTLISDYASSVDCENWEDSQLPYSRAQQTRLLLLITSYIMSPEFMQAAVFELTELESFIANVTLDEADLAPSADASNLDHEGSDPKYPFLGAAFRAANRREELDMMKDMAQDMASLCHALVVSHVESETPSDATDIDEAERSLFSGYALALASLHDISKRCTCSSGRQEMYRAKMAALSRGIALEKEMFEQVFVMLQKQRRTEDFFGEKLVVRRQYTGMFLTQIGFLGVSFQHEPGFQEGDKVVLMDGFLAPVVLRVEDAGDRFVMKTRVYVSGIDQVDAECLLELDVFRRRTFEIV